MEQIDAQDRDLDHLYVSIQNLKTIGTAINRELDEHHTLIDGLDDAVVAKDIRLGRTHSRLKKLNAYREKGEKGCIILVLVAFIVLLVIVILMN